MSLGLENINLGATAGDKTGDGARTGGGKINRNFEKIKAFLETPDAILVQTGYALVGQDLTFNSGWKWRIATLEYMNPEDVEIPFPLAAAGKSRLDVVVLTTSNTFLRVAGAESTSTPVAPSAPSGSLYVTVVLVTDGVVNQPEQPEVNGAYVQKSERANVVLTGSGVINQLNLVDEKATIVFKDAITRLNTISYASVPYNGKTIRLFNAQATPVTIGHSVSGYGVDFVFPDAQDYILLPNQTIEFSFDITYSPYAHHMLIRASDPKKMDKVSSIIDARTYNNLNEAVAEIALNEVTLLITNNQTTISNLIIPSNISVKIIKGGFISKNASNTIVFNGNFEAGLYKVFVGYAAGDIKFGKAVLKEIYPQWWGENITQGVTNMTLPIQSAINSILTSGGRVKIPVGSYLIDSLTIPYITNNFRAITIEGEGKWNIDGSTVYHNGTQLKSNSAVPMFAPVNNSDGITLKNMVLDGNNIGTYGWYGLFGSFTTLENCIFTKFTQIGAYTAQGLCQIKYCYSLKNAQGIKWNSDGIVEHNKIIGNTGDGLILTNGGNYVSDNEIEGNGGRGIYINGTLGNNANNIINNNYIENNLSWHIFLEGASTSNRTISKTRITGNYLSSIAVPNGNVSGGIKLLNSRASNIANNNFIGSFLGANLLEQQAILLENSDLISITNFVGEQGYRNAIKIVNSFDITIGDICLRDFAQVGTSSDDAFGIYINATCNRIYLSNIAISEYRGVGGFMKGIKSLVPISLVNYSVSTPVVNPDSIFGTLFYKDVSGATVMSLQNNVGVETIRMNGLDGSITASGNIAPQGLFSATGQITSSGSTSTTLFTLPNVNENRVYLIILRQSGSASNSVMGYVTSFGANSVALNIAQSNIVAPLLLALGSTGLNVQLTTGSGYGSTTWDWTYTRVK